mmetsp:Transcript_11074/g.18539  ORF Transcript_11074/g.18539 Transcript_11074/m.18539 type:complete len:158 (+) Transcript_11074:1830-2303(+)
MQVQPRITQFLPRLQLQFPDKGTKDANSKSTSPLICYGIILETPSLNYFKGGFELKGKFEQAEANEQACLRISRNSRDFISNLLRPEALKNTLFKFDSAFDVLEATNPSLASYLVKPSSLIDSYRASGFKGVQETLIERKDNFMSNVNPEVLTMAKD